ncbi:hypothetical protein HZB01_05210 [Candidatus Woesearchaeota archaeon]|nr:hypothetical protein [Candidatus Woesearchaeota archaeon]
MEPRGLEEQLQKKVKPVVDAAVQKYLGVNIEELSKDITSTVENPLAGFDINPFLPFRKAKQLFRKQYLERLLRKNYGNISEAAKITGTDRRTLHRVVTANKINVRKIREELAHPYTVEQHQMKHILEDVFQHYKEVIHPDKMESIYKNISSLSEDLLKDIPLPSLPFRDAEEEFERQYFQKVLSLHSNLAKAAKALGLRYETLHRKIKKLGLKH